MLTAKNQNEGVSPDYSQLEVHKDRVGDGIHALVFKVTGGKESWPRTVILERASARDLAKAILEWAGAEPERSSSVTGSL